MKKDFQFGTQLPPMRPHLCRIVQIFTLNDKSLAFSTLICWSIRCTASICLRCGSLDYAMLNWIHICQHGYGNVAMCHTHVRFVFDAANQHKNYSSHLIETNACVFNSIETRFHSVLENITLHHGLSSQIDLNAAQTRTESIHQWHFIRAYRQVVCNFYVSFGCVSFVRNFGRQDGSTSNWLLSPGRRLPPIMLCGCISADPAKTRAQIDR